METNSVDSTTVLQLRLRLLDLAHRQDELAAQEAASTPYWKPQPTSVHGHRAAANALRAEADLLLAAS